MTGAIVMLFLVLVPLTGLVLWSRTLENKPQQATADGVWGVLAKASAPNVIARAEHDQIVDTVVRNKDNLIDEMSYQRNKDVQHISALHAEVVRLQKMLDINDPSLEKVTIHRKEYERLRDCESLLSEIRQIVTE